MVVRRLVPAVRVELVLVHGPQGIDCSEWDAAVRDASQFAPFCARGVVVSRLASERESRNDMDLLLLKARYYGVGVAMQERTESLRWLLEPAPTGPSATRPPSGSSTSRHGVSSGRTGPDLVVPRT